MPVTAFGNDDEISISVGVPEREFRWYRGFFRPEHFARGFFILRIDMSKLFWESLHNHQKLIDVLVSHRRCDGVCEITRLELMQSLQKNNYTWISNAIKRINTIDQCITPVSGGYVVAYDKLIEHGVFNKIFEMMVITIKKPEIIQLKEAQIAELFDCSMTVVKMYKAYLLSGWKTPVKKQDMDSNSIKEKLEKEN